MRPSVPAALVLTAACTLLIACLTALPAAASSSGSSGHYAPLNRPGPRLSVPHRDLVDSRSCHGDPRKGPEPVLLSPATGVTPDQNYSWNYERAFTAQGRYWCAVTMPMHTLQDIQRSGEYLVAAIRRMHADTGRRIAVLGHSQGGMSMRWALRFWPRTRTMVDDVIGMAGSNHGTGAGGCGKASAPTCPAAGWQQQAKSHFLKALNSRAETFRGISYTEIYTHTDEVVQPNSSAARSSSSLRTGKGMITNVATQDICPADVYEHLLVGTIDPVAYALVMDALTHKGPAQPSRISRSVCWSLYQPYVSPLYAQSYLQVLAGLPGLLSVVGLNLVNAPQWKAEPPLRCYVFASRCPVHR